MADIEIQAEQGRISAGQAETASEQSLHACELGYRRQFEAAKDTTSVPDEDHPLNCFHK
jgi:hypothetical protein